MAGHTPVGGTPWDEEVVLRVDVNVVMNVVVVELKAESVESVMPVPAELTHALRHNKINTRLAK